MKMLEKVVTISDESVSSAHPGTPDSCTITYLMEIFYPVPKVFWVVDLSAVLQSLGVLHATVIFGSCADADKSVQPSQKAVRCNENRSPEILASHS